MEAVILIGIQASGKSSFFKSRFADSHVRLNLDMLRTRHREKILLRACFEAKQPFVVDNTNPTAADRQVYIRSARAAKFEITGYYFSSQLQGAIDRNAQRDRVVPREALLGTYNKLQAQLGRGL